METIEGQIPLSGDIVSSFGIPSKFRKIGKLTEYVWHFTLLTAPSATARAKAKSESRAQS